jgi:hypothetical protein
VLFSLNNFPAARLMRVFCHCRAAGMPLCWHGVTPHWGGSSSLGRLGAVARRSYKTRCRSRNSGYFPPSSLNLRGYRPHRIVCSQRVGLFLSDHQGKRGNRYQFLSRFLPRTANCPPWRLGHFTLGLTCRPSSSKVSNTQMMSFRMIFPIIIIISNVGLATARQKKSHRHHLGPQG